MFSSAPADCVYLAQRLLPVFHSRLSTRTLDHYRDVVAGELFQSLSFGVASASKQAAKWGFKNTCLSIKVGGKSR